MNNKFIKVSLSILAVSLIFIFGNKIMFKDLVYQEDSTNIHDKDVKISLERKYKSEKGINIKLKIDNPTKYICRLEEATLNFEQDGSKQSSYLKIELPYGWEEEGSNYKVRHEGIQPFSSDYIEFTIPKGLTLDSEYFTLDNVSLDYKWNFTVNIPFTNGAYTTIGQSGGSSTISGLSLSELEK